MAVTNLEPQSYHAFMARQPILDRSLKLIGYELLYRAGGTGLGTEVDGPKAVSALANALVELGLDSLVSSKKAFINIPVELINDELLGLFPKNGVVLEILETVPYTKESADVVDGLRRRGYEFAVDDYIGEVAQDPWMNHANIVKVDLMGVPESQLPEIVRKAKGTNRKTLAEKVETQEQFTLCKALGFDYFQGYFFAKPLLMGRKSLPPDRMQMMRLLSQLNDPNASIRQIEELVESNVTLAFRALRLINSAQMGIGHTVSSIREALMLLGLQKVAALASLVIMSDMPEHKSELTTTAMVRAKTCELLAKTDRTVNQEKCYAIGLLSVLDAMTDTPMEEIVQQLPLTDDVKDALTGAKDSGEANFLRAVRAYELGQWDLASGFVSSLEVIASAYSSALTWCHTQRTYA